MSVDAIFTLIVCAGAFVLGLIFGSRRAACGPCHREIEALASRLTVQEAFYDHIATRLERLEEERDR